MSCLYSLLNQVPGNQEFPDPQPNGTWTITRIESPVGTTIGSVTLNVNGTDVNLSTGNTVVEGDDSPDIDFSNAPSGEYDFTYTVSDGATPPTCSASSILTITVVEGVVSGQSITITKCDQTDTNYRLFSILEGGVAPNGGGSWTAAPQFNGNVTDPNLPNVTGEWSGSVNSPGFTPGADPTEATFNPSLHGEPGTLTFTYTVTNNQGDSNNCPNCTSSSTITFVITDTPYAGEDSTTIVCNDPNA